jgi:glycine/D-amino acid oxidase-like deaminating enzyme
MLAPQIEADGADPLFELGLAGRDRYRDLAAELLEDTGIDIGLWNEGIAQLATDEQQIPELKSKVAWQRQQGYLCDWLDAAEARDRWPWTGPAFGALWAPHDGALDPTSLVRALRTWAGLRPVTPDGLPIVGPAPGLDGLWYATGHGRNGILLAAITGLIISQLVAREPTHEDVSLLSPERYWRW